MGITPRFSQSDVSKAANAGKIKIENAILTAMKYVGETFVKEARENVNISGVFTRGDYTDRTANLRSSIGYFVLKDGEIVFEGLSGNSRGQQAAREALANIPDKTGYMLVGVAGMDYASYVEAKGFNVISSQADMAIVNMKGAFNRLISGADVQYTTSMHFKTEG